MKMTIEEKGYWVALSMAPGIGPRRFRKILDFFGRAEEAWRASPQALLKLLGASLATGFSDFRRGVDPRTIIEDLEKKGIKFFCACEAEYPRLLSEIFDPPPVLYYKGEFRAEDALAIAVIGSRSASPGGLMVAQELARGLAATGVTIISGLARGIDSAAHRGALLDTGGRTIAVLGSGLDRIYPPENDRLAIEITERGALCTEYPPGTEPLARNFPARNRIISGLALGVTVVEATADSGSLITVDFALEQGREVFAVPGTINRKRSQGTNRLIKEGAFLVDSVEDILQVIALNRLGRTRLTAEETATTREGDSPVEKRILSILTEEEYHIDMLVRLTGYSPAEVGAALVLMEMKGLVFEIAPGIYRKCK
jgi:DNA processing protein